MYPSRTPGRGLRWTIDCAAFRHNVGLARRHLSTARFLAVLKANAYGFGAQAVAKAIADLVDGFAVGSQMDAIPIHRAFPDKPILVYPSPIVQTQRIDNVILTAWDRGSFEEILAGPQFEVAVKLDVGLGRLGFQPSVAQEVVSSISRAGKHCAILYTHLCSPAGNTELMTRQFQLFVNTVSAVRGSNLEVGTAMCASTAAILQFPEMSLDAANCGHLIYGFPIPESLRGMVDLREPTESIVGPIIQLRNYSAGDRLGYSDRITLKRDTRVAVVAAGYSDGYPAEGQSTGAAIVNGKLAALLQPPSLEHTMLDVTGVSCQEGDDTVFVGGNGHCSISWHQAAEWAGKSEVGLSVGLKPTEVNYRWPV